MTTTPQSTALLGLVVGQEQLQEYFAHHETSSAQSSNYLEMCRALARVEVSETCQRCEGTGIRPLSKAQMNIWRRQIAKSDNPTKLRDQMIQSTHCPDCNGTAVVLKMSRFVAPDSMFNTVACPVDRGVAQRPCPHPDCDGGCIIPITVREMGSSRSGYLPRTALAFGSSDDFGASGLALGEQIVAKDNLDLDELAKTGEVVDLVRARDAQAANALARFHGPEGDKWARTKWGRAFSVWDLTSPGRRFAEEAARASKAGSGFLLNPLDRLASVRLAEATTKVPNVRWRAFIKRTDTEARELLARADALLVEVTR